MRSLHKDQSGITAAAMTTFATLITIAVVWNILTPTLEVNVFEFSENRMRDEGILDRYETTFDMIFFIWKYWPLILLGATMTFLFLSAQREQSQQGFI